MDPAARTRRSLVWALTGVYLLWLGLVTLRPGTGGDPGWIGRTLLELSRWPLTGWLGLSRLEFTANIVLFVPFGVLVSVLLGRSRWWLVLLLAAATTGAIELAQRGIPYRVSDPRDLVANTLGAAIGLGLTLLGRSPR